MPPSPLAYMFDQDRPKRVGSGIAASGSGYDTSSESDGVSDGGLRLLLGLPVKSGEATLGGYKKCLWAYRGNHSYSGCVDLLTEMVMLNGLTPGARSWRLVPAKDDDGNPIKNPDPRQKIPFYNFARTCSRDRTFEQLLKRFVADYVLARCSFGEVGYNGFDQPAALWTLAQSEMRARTDRSGELLEDFPFAQVRKGEDPKLFPWKKVLFFRDEGVPGSGALPMTPVEKIEASVRTSIQSELLTEAFFKSGAKLGTIFENTKWGKPQADAFLKFIVENHTNSQDGFKPYMLYGGTTIREQPRTAAELLQYLLVQQYDVRKVCPTFGVDPHLISAPGEGALGRSDREQMWRECILRAVNPRKVTVANQFTDQILRQGFNPPITDWDLDLVLFRDAVDAAARKAEASAFLAMTTAGYVFPDRREDLNRVRSYFDSDLTEIREDEMEGVRGHLSLVRPELDSDATPDGTPGNAPLLPAGEDVAVQDTALNGAQMASILELVQSVATGAVPEESAIEMMMVSFPGVTREEAARLIKPAVGFNPPREREPEPPPEPETRAVWRRAPRGIEKRLDWKAIESHLSGWVDGTLASTLAGIKSCLTKSSSALCKAYDARDINAVTGTSGKDGREPMNLLPGFGQVAAAGKKAIKDFYWDSHQMATDELSRLAKDVKVAAAKRKIMTAATGDIEDFLQLFGKKKFDQLYANLTTDQVGTFETGLRSGWDLPEFRRQLEVSAGDYAERVLDTIIRTSATDLFNMARVKAGSESDIVQFYTYSAILDDRTTEVCEKLDGCEIDATDPDLARVTPPNHYNCRSILSPGLVGEPFDPASFRAQLDAGKRLIQEKFGGKVS